MIRLNYSSTVLLYMITGMFINEVSVTISVVTPGSKEDVNCLGIPSTLGVRFKGLLKELDGFNW